MKAQSVLAETIDTARVVVEIASDKLASDIVLLDVRDLCNYADYLVLVNGEAVRQLDAMAEEIVRHLKQKGIALVRREGTATSGWIVLDFSDVIVHIFAPFERAYYNLDDMWSAASSVVRLA